MLEYVLLGVFTSSILLVLILLFACLTLKQSKILLPIVPTIFAALFSFSCLLQPIDVNPILLIGAISFSLVGTIIYWREMLTSPTENIPAWLLITVSLLVIVVNQLFVHSVTLFLLPPLLFSVLVITELFIHHGQQTQELADLEQQIEKHKTTSGMDLAIGLPNKLAFADRINKWLLINPPQKLNIVVFKLTEFDSLNRLIGHGNADIVKAQLVTRLKQQTMQNKDLLLLSQLNGNASMASLGGVDFVVAVNESDSNFGTEKLVKQLSNSISEPLVVNATALNVGVEFGIASYPQQGITAEELIEHAYIALNQREQLDTSMYFDPSFEAQQNTNRLIISQLREDINNNKFELYVQPQVNLTTNQVMGGEVLVRWRNNEQGIMEANQFIDLAEQSGVIYQLSLWGFEQAIKKLAEPNQAQMPQYLAVNVSNKELFQDELVEAVCRLLDQYSVNPAKLVVEIKESAFAANQNRALKVSHLLQQKGIKVALDDFGKDQTAISCFASFTPYYVKVDCRGLNTAKRSDKNNTYLNAIIGLAKSLGIPTIAQGIEMETTLSQLQDIECDLGQGFLFSKPFELTGFDIWLEQWQRQQSQPSPKN